MSTGVEDSFEPSSEMHPGNVVLNALATLEGSGVVFALLRGDPASSPTTGDVDLLMRAADMAKAEDCLRSIGWIAAPAAGYGSHRFLVNYDHVSGTWHQLDCVNSLDFGPIQAYRTGLAEACLARRVWNKGVPRLHADDEFWALFLHQAWKTATLSRRAALSERAHAARAEGPVADFIARLLPNGIADANRLLAGVRSDDWDTVRASQRMAQRELRRQRHGEIARTHIVNWIARRAPIAKARGLSLALLGLDGAGKTTTAARLHAEVPWPTVSLYMGVWRESSLDRLVQHVLGAQLALRLGRLTRTALVAHYHRALGRLVLLDRYVTDANLPSPDLDWKGKVSAFLVLRTATAPDRLVFLDAAPEVVFARKGELTIEELRRRRECYHALKGRFPQMVVVDAERPLDAVVRDVNEVLWGDLVRSSSTSLRRLRRGDVARPRTIASQFQRSRSSKRSTA
jgi:thymidylate kinase